MTWHYRFLESHVSIEVFSNGGYAGHLCLRLDDFNHIRTNAAGEFLTSQQLGHTTITFVHASNSSH